MRPLTALMGLAGMIYIALPFAPADAQWVFVARRVLGRIEHMQQGGQDGQPATSVATVVLSVPADRVYAKASELAHRNPSVQVLADDPVQRRLDEAEGADRVALTVQVLNRTVSQLVILGSATAASRTVEAVLRVCKELNKTCTPAN